VSPQGYEGLVDGEHTFAVRATDGTGNLGAAASYTWTVDTVAPETAINAAPPELSRSSSARFEFDAGEPATFECLLDAGEWVACVSGQSYADLAGGVHTFQVRAADRAGKRGARAGRLHLDDRHSRAGHDDRQGAIRSEQ
jgi:large repetitive protein